MPRYMEKIGRIGDVRTVETGKYFTLEVDYVTAGGISKTLTLAHSDAAWLGSTIHDALTELPEERRKRSFFASLRRKR
jgi:hypothetical protein